MQKSAFMFAPAIAVIGAPASAAAVPDLSSVTVPVAASDFASEAAMKTLVHKVQLAASQVCKEEFSSDDGDLFTRECELGAIEDGLAQIGKIHSHQLTTVTTASIVIVAR